MKDENPFRDAIARLRKWPLSQLFLFKSRVLGSVLDARSLVRTGWRNVYPPGSETRLWKQCLWWEREFRSDAGPVLVRVSTSPIVRPKEEDPADFRLAQIDSGRLYDELDEPDGESLVFLRKVRFFETADGGLVGAERPTFADDEVLDVVRAALLECEVRGWTSLGGDWGFQTMGGKVPLPPNVPPTAFELQAAVMDAILQRVDEYSVVETAERYLVRFVRAVADETYSPESQADLAAFSNGLALWHFVNGWFDAAPHDGAAARLLAWALERADGVAEPFKSVAWLGVGVCLGRLGFYRESVLAAVRAVDCEGAPGSVRKTLWEFIVACVNELFREGCKPDGKPDVAWLVELLFEREGILRKNDGYWTLLGLLLAENGNETKTALETIGKEYGANTPQAGFNESPPPAPPRERLAIAAVSSGDPARLRCALAAFPSPPAAGNQPNSARSDSTSSRR